MSILLTVVRFDGEVYGMPGERSMSLPTGAEFVGWEYSTEPLSSVNHAKTFASLVLPVSEWFHDPERKTLFKRALGRLAERYR